MTTAIQFQFSGLEFVFKKYHQTCFKGQFFFFVFVETKVVRDCCLSSRAFWPASVVIAQILLFDWYELTWLGQIRQSNLDLEWKEEHKNKYLNLKIKMMPSNFFGTESLKLYLLSMILASSSIPSSSLIIFFFNFFSEKRKRWHF